MTNDKLSVEARARIIWGEEPASVRQFLTSSGMSPTDAENKIQEFSAERNREIRKMGIWNVCLGALVLCLSAAFIYFVIKQPSTRFPTKLGKAMFAAILAGFWGLWKLVNGLIRLIRPKSETQSITDLSG